MVNKKDASNQIGCILFNSLLFVVCQKTEPVFVNKQAGLSNLMKRFLRPGFLPVYFFLPTVVPTPIELKKW
jgi:hypothetical protein